MCMFVALWHCKISDKLKPENHVNYCNVILWFDENYEIVVFWYIGYMIL